MDRAGRHRPWDETELELIEQARQGNSAAFEELVRRYQDLAFRVAYTIVGIATDAEDVTQDAFIRAYSALGRFRAGAPFRPWLLTIVANTARTRRSSIGRHPTFDLSAADHAASDDRSPEEHALSMEDARELMHAMERLRPDDRQVLICRYVLALSEAESAAVLGCPRGTVKSRQSRALRRLRQQLAATHTLRGEA